MLRMISYPRRPQSGHITCYLNRTYHVLPTARGASQRRCWQRLQSVKAGSTKVNVCKDRKCFFCLRIILIVDDNNRQRSRGPSAGAIFRNLSQDSNVQPMGTELSTTTPYAEIIIFT